MSLHTNILLFQRPILIQRILRVSSRSFQRWHEWTAIWGSPPGGECPISSLPPTPWSWCSWGSWCETVGSSTGGVYIRYRDDARTQTCSIQHPYYMHYAYLFRCLVWPEVYPMTPPKQLVVLSMPEGVP